MIDRAALLAAAAYTCQRCGTYHQAEPRRLHIHHTSALAYAREWPGDLAVVCARCHGQIHAAEARARS